MSPGSPFEEFPLRPHLAALECALALSGNGSFVICWVRFRAPESSSFCVVRKISCIVSAGWPFRSCLAILPAAQWMSFQPQTCILSSKLTKGIPALLASACLTVTARFIVKFHQSVSPKQFQRFFRISSKCFKTSTKICFGAKIVMRRALGKTPVKTLRVSHPRKISLAAVAPWWFTFDLSVFGALFTSLRRPQLLRSFFALSFLHYGIISGSVLMMLNIKVLRVDKIHCSNSL